MRLPVNTLWTDVRRLEILFEQRFYYIIDARGVKKAPPTNLKKSLYVCNKETIFFYICDTGSRSPALRLEHVFDKHGIAIIQAVT